MSPLAVSTLEKLQKVPTSFWVNAGITILIVIVGIFILFYIKEMNKIFLTIILAVVFTIVGFSWIYERNEPAFLTPIVNVMAQFLPSKGMYQDVQKADSDKTKKSTPISPKKP